ncbi:hypothetical protein BOX15_Mlig014208g2 [Macrostomum lignano]|uniref:Uncharacterized protein n=1 Tax=Macrostomum lignano TaxID=282301 RepID=A0A267G7L0_9PLAT|nr:hypothetical protein BOX15_Mlig014208g2 [Macrostomum lignano]
MSESQTFIEQWDDEGTEDKAELLDELILVQAGDVGKLNVNEVMLRYFENRRKLGCDSWDNDNQALRQLFSASSRVPRVRHFPGSAGRVVGRPKVPAGGSGGVSGASRRPLAQQQPLRLLDDSGSRQKQTKPAGGSSDATRQLAQHMIASEDTYEGIEKELMALSERLVEQSLSQAVYNSAVHQLAVRLVRRALDRASEHLGSRNASDLEGSSSSKAGDNDSERIDAIAQELARNTRGGDPRELTFTSDRAASVAEGLLDQVMADAAEVVSKDDQS